MEGRLARGRTARKPRHRPAVARPPSTSAALPQRPRLPPGSDDPAKPKNHTALSTSATPTEIIITVSSTERRRRRSRSPRIDFIHAACCGLPSSRPVMRPW